MATKATKIGKKRRWPRGVKKFIRMEKARIRRVTLDINERQRLIQELYARFTPH